MRKLASRGFIALGMVITLGLCTPVLASAGSSGNQGSSTSKGLHTGVAAYLATRHTIQVDFRSAIDQARTTYESTLATSTSSAQRSAARQVYEAAIIEAATARSAALTALGPEPGSGKSSGGQGKSN
ncbi:MAG TPA: hypothetical protein VMV11_07190 [Acidimicrobiales bacterium]|nr:hypothetical protein [Acidimicrobiales bacterium]